METFYQLAVLFSLTMVKANIPVIASRVTVGDPHLLKSYAMPPPE